MNETFILQLAADREVGMLPLVVGQWRAEQINEVRADM